MMFDSWMFVVRNNTNNTNTNTTNIIIIFFFPVWRLMGGYSYRQCAHVEI